MNISGGNFNDGSVRLYGRVKQDRGESSQANDVVSLRGIFERIELSRLPVKEMNHSVLQ